MVLCKIIWKEWDLVPSSAILLDLDFGHPLVENDVNYIGTWTQVTQFDLKTAEYTTWGTSDKGENRNEQGKVKATEPQGIQSVDHWGGGDY